MPILILEEPTLRSGRSIVATTTDRQVIAAFWRAVLAESAAVVEELEACGDEILAALERAEREKLQRVAPLFGATDVYG